MFSVLDIESDSGVWKGEEGEGEAEGGDVGGRGGGFKISRTPSRGQYRHQSEDIDIPDPMLIQHPKTTHRF